MSLNGVDAPFVFSDRYTVLLNPSIAGDWNLRGVLLFNIARPVLNLSYAIDSRIWGISSFGFHTTNVLLHITAVALFYGWCTRALSDVASARPAAIEWPAFVAAAVFAVHPAMSGAVAYVSARSELLAAIGVFACLTCARRAILVRTTRAAAMAIACGALAIGSSSSAAALPLIVLAYDAWVLRENGWRRRCKTIYAPLAVVVLVAAVTQVLRTRAVSPRNIFQTVVAQGTIVCRYLGMLVMPRETPLLYDATVIDRVSAIGLVLLAVIGAAVWYAVRTRDARPLVAFGVCWFVAVLAPTAILPFQNPMGEHRLYLASAGLWLAAASMLADTLTRRASARAVAAVVILLLGARTYQRNRDWFDPLPLWRASVERAPGSWLAHRELAEVLRDAGICVGAEEEFRRTRELNPRFVDRQSHTTRCEASK